MTGTKQGVQAGRQRGVTKHPSVFSRVTPKQHLSLAVTLGTLAVTVTTKETPRRAGLVDPGISERYSPGAVPCVVTSV